MRVAIGLIDVPHAAQSLDHIGLGVRLPRVDHVINRLGPAKVRVRLHSLFGRNPAFVIGVGEKRLVAKVLAQQAELPQVVGDVLADVGDRAIRADDNLGVLIKIALGNLGAGPGHHPAALVLALALEVEHAGLLQLLEGRLPELQVQNLALAGQKIVLYAQAQHGFQVPPQDRGRNQLGNRGRFVAAVLDLVQRGVAQLLARLIFFIRAARVPLRGLRIELPAVVIEGASLVLGVGCAAFAFLDERTHLGDGFAFQVQESHHHIGHLHAGVVDIVLHIDLLSGGAQQADEGVAQNGVAQVADVRGLVGIDAGVLDQGMDLHAGFAQLFYDFRRL